MSNTRGLAKGERPYFHGPKDVLTEVEVKIEVKRGLIPCVIVFVSKINPNSALVHSYVGGHARLRRKVLILHHLVKSWGNDVLFMGTLFPSLS